MGAAERYTWVMEAAANNVVILHNILPNGAILPTSTNSALNEV